MNPAISAIQILGWGILLAWLGVCSACDLRSRKVPARLTVPPFVLAGVWQFYQGGWQPVLLVVSLVLISDLPAAKWRISLAGLATVLALSVSRSGEQVYSLLVILAIWAMWEVGATGGADAKIILTLVLLFGNGLVFIPIVFVGGIQGLVGLVSHQKTIPYTVAITLGTVAWFWMTVGS